MIGSLLVAFLIHRHSRQVVEFNQKDFVKILNASDAGIYVTLEGKPTSLVGHMGKPFALIAWASWCPSCGDQLHMLGHVASERSFPIIAVNRGETLGVANDFLRSIQRPEGLEYVVDTKDIVFSTMGGFAMPELIIYNAGGVETYHSRGTLTEEELRLALEKVNVK